MRVALLATMLLAACTAEVAPPLDETAPIEGATAAAPLGASAAVYLCSDSTEVFALFASDSMGASTVALAIGDERIRMRQVEAASGAKYADPTGVVTLWNTGTEVTFARGDEPPVTCTAAGPTATGSSAPSGAHAPTP